MLDYTERWELVRCEICEGERVLVDVCGESVCGWCDGTGTQEALVWTAVSAAGTGTTVSSGQDFPAPEE